jgi:PAS domain S-box-containing protein
VPLTEDFDVKAFNLSADLICVAGLDGYFKRINPSFMQTLGYSEAELLNRPFVDFVHPDDVAATMAETSALGSGEHLVTRPFQNRYRCADGSYRWLEWRSQTNTTDGYIYASARDITAQKEIERTLQEYSRELERSNGELQQFAYVASHDLQEPLRAVAGCVQMLAEHNDGKLDEKSAELMRHAVDGALRMQALISDLLNFSRVGSKGINLETIDTAPVVAKALTQLEAAIRESAAVIIVDPLPRIRADAVQLTQLFQNLIGNALKFRGDRVPEIHIYAADGDDGTTFSVADNGIGIAPEYHERIFGIFQRLNSRRNYAGTGIGLAICKKIVDRHGGRMWVESRPEGGTIFRFVLPKEFTC